MENLHLNDFPSTEKLTQRIRGYKVDVLLEQNGATALYRGLQEALDRVVDIKIMPNIVSVPEIVRRRFLREAHAMAQLSHPHVLNVYDHGEVPGLCQYIVFEEGRGRSLRTILSEPLEPAKALCILSDVGEAVAYTHEQGIVHRNINPEDILVNDLGRAKLKNFSFAKMEGGETVMSHVADLEDSVNRFNQAPEYHARVSMDHRVDVYSLGVLLYEMLTGEVPKKVFNPPSQVASVSAQVDRLVLRCMHPHPKKRFSDVRELLNAVELLQKKPEKLTAGRTPFYIRLVPKTRWILLGSLLMALLIMLFNSL